MNPLLLYAPAIIAPVIGFVAWIWSKHLTHDLETQIAKKKVAAAADQPEFDLSRNIAESKSVIERVLSIRVETPTNS